MKKYILLLLVLFFISCDGGDPWDLATKNIDSTPPVFSSVTANSVASISANFNEPVSGSIEVLDSSSAVVAGSVSSSGNSIVFIPSSSLTRGETYTVNFTSSVQDQYGNTLPAPASQTVTTPTAPTYISSPADGATAVALDSSIIVTFSEPVTFIDSNVTLTVGGSSVNFSVSWNLLHNAATINPDNNYSNGDNVVLSINNINAIIDNEAVTWNNISFAAIDPPVLTTDAVVGDNNFTVYVKGVSAKVGVNITDQGASAVTERGICFNTTGSPDVDNDTKVTDGSSGTGSFFVDATGLTSNTVYYVRAYAVNGDGVGYGNEITFNSGYEMGASAEGGYVFYNDGNGGGMVIATADTLNPTAWSNPSNTSISTSDNIGSGSTNTSTIISETTTSTANAVRTDFGSDWYLPSKDELILIYTNLAQPGVITFLDRSLWSSSQISATDAYSFNLNNGSVPANAAKTQMYYSRPVKSF